MLVPRRVVQLVMSPTSLRFWLAIWFLRLQPTPRPGVGPPVTEMMHSQNGTPNVSFLLTIRKWCRIL